MDSPATFGALFTLIMLVFLVAPDVWLYYKFSPRWRLR